jgi:chromosomal replication initiation ATPase DnaA
MSGRPEQLPLDLPHRSAFDAQDFLVSVCNEAAVAVIDRWPDWPAPVLAIVGPAGSGKSHLVNVWRTRSIARVSAASALREETISEFQRARALAVEDIDRGLANEQALFHILNVAAEQKHSVLLTSRLAPGELEITLPDLRSRLRAAPVVNISTPDEPLLRALLVKLFSDRQLAVEPNVISYLALRIERSAEAAQRAVEVIDRLALASRRKVTRAFVADVLGTLEGPEPD